MTAKSNVRRNMARACQLAIPETTVHLMAVGSTINGCGHYSSDMDLCLLLPSTAHNGHFFYNFDKK